MRSPFTWRDVMILIASDRSPRIFRDSLLVDVDVSDPPGFDAVNDLPDPISKESIEKLSKLYAEICAGVDDAMNVSERKSDIDLFIIKAKSLGR